MNSQQFFQNRPESVQSQRIGAVTLGASRVVMHLEEDTIHTRGHGSPRQHRNKLRLRRR